jgi:uncharacterized OB-fold protein
VSEHVSDSTDVLSAHHILEYPYTRAVGPVVGRFLTGLRERRIEGVRTREGRVLVPPVEYDPATAEPVTETFVEVGPAGVVATWCWVAQPRPQQPLDHPFAWALIKLDGADTTILHAVDCGSPSAISSGLRVRPRWREQTVGMITDLVCFEPEAR